MSLPADRAIRAWVNARADLIGEGMPLSRGAFLRSQSSPADGAYAVLSRNSEGVGGMVAEDAVICVARMQALVFAGTVEAAENAAAALRSAFETLTGCPEPCGTTGITVLVADNHIGPMLVPGELEKFCFQVGADFALR